MMAPGGFDSTIEKWTTSGIWADMKPLETLTSRYTCIAYDRREAVSQEDGWSGFPGPHTHTRRWAS